MLRDAKHTRIIVIGRWGTRPTRDWYPWFTRQAARFGTVTVPEMPHPDEPVVGDWTKAVADTLEEVPQGVSCLVVGHSVGCQAIVRALASRNPPAMLGAVFVAGWWEVANPWPALKPWCLLDYAVEKARYVLPTSRVLLSSNDPFNPDYESNARVWRDRLGSEVEIVPNAAHFNRSEEPRVLKAVETILRAVSP